MIAHVPGILPLETRETLRQQRRSPEHDHRQRDLRRDQRLPNGAPPARLASRSRVEPEGRREIGSSGSERRPDAENQHRQRRDGDRRDHRRSRELDVVEPRKIRRRETNEESKQRERPGEPKRAAGRRESGGLDDQLTNDVAIRRAQRTTDRDLTRARRGAEQQQVADVEAGDQQQETHGGRQHREHRPHVAEHRFRERRRVRAAEVDRGCDALFDREVFVARGGERGARPQSCNGKRRYVRRPSGPHRRPIFRAGRVVESRRRDADDHVGRSAQWIDQATPKHRRIAAELLVPGAIADDEVFRHQPQVGRCVASFIIARAKQAAERGPHAQDVEEVAGDHAAVEPDRAIAVQKGRRRGRPVRDAGDVAHRPRFAPHDVQLRRAHRDFGRGIEAVRPHHGDAILIDHRKSPNQHGAEDGEHRHRHSDAKRENDRGRHEKRRRSTKTAHGEPKVLPQSIHPSPLFERSAFPDRTRNRDSGPTAAWPGGRQVDRRALRPSSKGE